MENTWSNIAKIGNYLAILFTIVYIGFYYWLCEDVAINFPMGDDTYQTTIWLHAFYHAPTTAEQLQYYFMQYNSHFLLSHYLVSVLDYHVFGHVSYKHLIIFGNLLLLGIWGLLFYQFREKDKPNFLLFLPITLILFTPVDQMINWAGTAVHNGSMILFGFLAVWAFAKQKTGWTILSVVAMFMSMFSLVGGLAVPIAGAIMFVSLNNKDYKQLLIWLIGSALCYGLFFCLWENIVVGKQAMDVQKAILLFFSFLGSPGTIHQYFRTMAPTVGLLSSVFLLYAYVKSDFFSKHPSVFGGLLFMVGIAAFTAIGRNHLGPVVAAKNKYFWMQGAYFACFCFLFMKQSYLTSLKKELLALAILLALIIPVTIKAFQFEKVIINRSKTNTIEFVNNYNRKLKKGDHGVYHAANIQIIVNRGVRDGYFKLPDFYNGRPVEPK